FKEYLTEYRISKAADLLLHTDRKISEIGGMIGYMDNDYFLKKFIEIKGCTPSKFRKSRTNH
ncbi:MAG: helix-turn-helix domain-containing protein, partial [Lachnospiraceae bacterium]